MKLLLHICCAPCSIHPYRQFSLNNRDSITGFFYNPNIHPFTEYARRKDALLDYSKNEKIEVVFHKYDMENFFREISGSEAPPARCGVCWRMRLLETAVFAKKNGFDAFSTTLLVSPYQDQGNLKRIGQDISRKTGIEFLYRDFRDGFRASQDEARGSKLYRQKYCGCIYSEKERFEKKTK